MTIHVTIIKDQIIIKDLKPIMFVLFEHFRGIKNIYLYLLLVIIFNTGICT